MSDNFFVSDSLKDIIDEQLLLDEFFKQQLDSSSSANLTGKFESVDLRLELMTLEISSKVAKVLLGNPDKVFTISFMDEKWVLSSEGMKLQQCKDGKFHATLKITDRLKEDTYERTV